MHVHLPAGSTPKDGPSAGVTIAVALISLFTGKQCRSDTAMTGELTLHGTVLPVGGIQAKVTAAHRSGMLRVLVPEANEEEANKAATKCCSREGAHAMRIIPVKTALQAVDAAMKGGLPWKSTGAVPSSPLAISRL